MEDFQPQTKSSAKRIMIKDLNNHDVGKNVQVVGYVKEIIDQSSIILTDKTGDLTVDLAEQDFSHKENDLINVFAIIRPTMEGKLKLEANFIQNMKGLNFENYIKIYDMKKELI